MIADDPVERAVVARTCGAALSAAAARRPESTALVDPARRLSFSDLRAQVADRCRLLLDAGVRPGDRVLLQLDNGADLVSLVLATWQIRAVAVPVVTLFRKRELTTVVRETLPVAVIAAAVRGDRRPVDELETALGRNGHHPHLRLCVGGDRAGWNRLPDVGTSGIPVVEHADYTLPPVEAGDTTTVLFTSGTTSEPKGVRHDSRSLWAAAETYRRSARLGAHDNVLVTAPMAHVGGLICGTLLPLLIGAAAVLLPRWEVGPAADLIAAERVTFTAAAVPVVADLVDHYERDAGGHRLIRFHTGAAPTSPELIERADRCGITAWRSWGMTEYPNATVSGRDAPLAERSQTDGEIQPGVEVEAVDENLRPVAAGVTGNLRVRGVKLMQGYTAASLADSIDGDGWFLTGDLGAVRADRRVVVTGRSKDVINRGGEKFSAQDIEDAIRSHEAVSDVAVVGRPDERLGEQVVAFVVPAGTARPDARELITHLAEVGLARQKFPVAWSIVDDLPRTATGKVVKRALVARAAEQQSQVSSTDITI